MSTAIRGTAVPSAGVFDIEQVGPIACVGDCNGDHTVTVDELAAMAGVALGNAAAASCVASDPNRDNRVTIDEILTAVNKALQGCNQ